MNVTRTLAALALVLTLSFPLFGQQNVTVVEVDPPSRLVGRVLGEWATNGDAQSWTGSGVTTLAVQGGVLGGEDTSAAYDASVSLAAMVSGPDLDLGFNDFLQIRLKLPAAYTGDVRMEFGTSTLNGFAATRSFVLSAASMVKDGAFHTYRLDLGLEVFWRDTLRDIRITPLLASTGRFEIDYVEVGDVAGTAPALNTDTNFLAPITAVTASRLESKHFCVWWDPANTNIALVHVRRALRMCEESYQVFCKKLGYNEPFREFNSTTTPRQKVNFVTWYDGYWMGGHNNRGILNVDLSGLGDEGPGNPVPHEFAHVVQAAQPGYLHGGHWESHANYLQAQRNLHFFDAIPNAITGIENLNGNSNYRPDHSRHIYADQRYYLSLDDYGSQFGLPTNFTAAAWRDGLPYRTLIEKLAAVLPQGQSLKDVGLECWKRWPMLDFVEKVRLRQQHWGTPDERAEHFWKQGAQLVPLQDKPGWWRVPPERAPDGWAYQMHNLVAGAGATVTAEVRAFDKPGTSEDLRWCFAAISAGDTVRYSSTWAQGAQSFTLNASETQVFLIVAATPDSVTLDLLSLSNTKPVDKDIDRLRYGYEVRLVNAAPAPNRYSVATPAGSRNHPNGGGVIAPGAVVDSTAYVGPNARVLETARVLENARVEDYAVVKGQAMVQGNAVVSGFALVDGNASVEGEARIRDRAQLLWGSVIRDRALVAGYARVERTMVTDDAIVRGCAFPFGGVISGTAILDHDYSLWFSVADGVHFNHVPWGGWWDSFSSQTLRKPQGLIASYRTSETSGQDWWDEFGALHALLRGGPTRVTDAMFGSSVMSFDGVDDYAVLDRSLSDTPRITFSCWVRPANAPGTEEPLLFMGSSDTRALRLTRSATAQVVFSISDGTSSAALTSVGTLPQNLWTHVAVQLDGTSARLFINGINSGSAATKLTPLSVLAANDHTSQQANYMARNWNGALFSGSIEDARFYNVTLTEAEVGEEMTRRGDMLGQFAPRTPVSFDGTSTLAQSGVPNGRVRTLSAWLRPRTSKDVSNYEAVFDSGDERRAGEGSGFGLNRGRWVVRLDGLGLWETNVSATLNRWQHVALAFNGSTATLFVDGVQVATRSYTGPAADTDAAGKCFRIGYSQTTEDTASCQFFDGDILNARIFDRALTASQIATDSDGDGFTDPVEANLGADPINPLSLPSRYAVSGTVRTFNGEPVSGASVYLSESPGAAASPSFAATTDSAGQFSFLVTPGAWYLAAGMVAYNFAADALVTVRSADIAGVDFTLVASARVSGRVTRLSDGAAVSGATVSFAASSGGAAVFTTTTDSTGYYTQSVWDGMWFVTAVGSGYHTSTESMISVNGANFGGINLSLLAVGRPRTSDLFFSALTASLPAKDGATEAWPTYLPSSQMLATLGSPTVEIFNGAKWVNNLYADGDGFHQGAYTEPVAINGATIVVAVRPTRNAITTAWTSIVDILYNRLMLGIRNDTGIVTVCRNGSYFAGPAIPNGQATVLSLVAQLNGQFKVYANGVEIMSETSTSSLTSLVPGAWEWEWYMKDINIGRNNWDTWTTFNGLIGDVFVYKVALTTTERQEIEADLMARFVSPRNVITASAGTGGTINPTGPVLVPQGGSQPFTIAPLPGYQLTGITVNGVAQPVSGTYTFTNVNAAQTIAATFAESPISAWRWSNFAHNWTNATISGDLVDYDGDGMCNLLEYALGSSPAVASSVSRPIAQVPGLRLQFSFFRARSDVTYYVESSSDLSPVWTVFATNPGVVGQSVTVTDTVDLTAANPPRRFMRLRVTSP